MERNHKRYKVRSVSLSNGSEEAAARRPLNLDFIDNIPSSNTITLTNKIRRFKRWSGKSTGSSPSVDMKDVTIVGLPKFFIDPDSHSSGHSIQTLCSDSVFNHPVEPGAYVPITGDEVKPICVTSTKMRDKLNLDTRRLVYKDGTCNIAHGSLTERNRKYLFDIFTTIMDMKWRYNVMMFVTGFVLSWFFFAIVWYMVAAVHGDIWMKENENWTFCVANVYDFPTALLYSIETQHTIGYGFRHIQSECPDAFIVLMCQCCVGLFIQTMMAGIIFTKLSQPKRRAHTIMFSKKACISKRDDEYCLLFRVGDMRKSHFVNTAIRAIVIKDRRTKEGELIPLSQYPMEIQTETCLTDNADDNFVFLVWPVTAVHKINKYSPLWDVSAESLTKEHFEIIIIMEGVVEASGMTTQIRTSYLPSEILWGHRPASLVAYQKENGVYRINYSQFHAVVPVTMPEYSAKEFAEKELLASKNPELRKSATAPVALTSSFNQPPVELPKRLHGTARSRYRRLVRTIMPFRRLYTSRSVPEHTTVQLSDGSPSDGDQELDQSRILSIS